MENMDTSPFQGAHGQGANGHGHTLGEEQIGPGCPRPPAQPVFLAIVARVPRTCPKLSLLQSKGVLRSFYKGLPVYTIVR